MQYAAQPYNYVQLPMLLGDELLGDEAHTAIPGDIDLDNDSQVAAAFAGYLQTHPEGDWSADFPDIDWHWFIPIIGPFIFDYQAVKSILDSNPEIKQMVKDTFKKILAYPSQLADTGITLLKILPWAIGGLVVAAVVFAFKNPETIKYIR